MSRSIQLKKIKEVLQVCTSLKPKLFYLEEQYYVLQGKTIVGLKPDEVANYIENYNPELIALNTVPIWNKEKLTFDDSEFRASLPDVFKTANIQTVESATKAIELMNFLLTAKLPYTFELLRPGVDKRGVHYPGCVLIETGQTIPD